MQGKLPLHILLCSPRGFCAGVVRALAVVEEALRRYGAPVYVYHQIVHNKYVVDLLKAKGAIFVEELDEVPDTDAPVIFSAHGASKSISAAAMARCLFTIDATCPLVTKVHREAELHYRRGRTVILIGHAGHPEVVGTMGQLPAQAVLLVETGEDIAGLRVLDESKLAYVTQTTLSVDDTLDLVAELRLRFPNIVGPRKEDICYATMNRQEAVRRVASVVDAVIVVGSPNSSNSVRLKEVAQNSGCPRVQLVQRETDIDWARFCALRTLAVTAGASAPEVLVKEIIDAFAQRYATTVEVISNVEETVFFPLPRELRPGSYPQP